MFRAPPSSYAGPDTSWRREAYRVALIGPECTPHTELLERAGLVAREVRGREHRLRLRARPLQEAAAFADSYRRFWDERLDALETFVTSPGGSSGGGRA